VRPVPPPRPPLFEEEPPSPDEFEGEEKAAVSSQARKGPRVGRRQLRKGQGEGSTITFRCSPELRAKLDGLAARWGISLNAALVKVLEEHGHETDRAREVLIQALLELQSGGRGRG
jgi:hypothetical protein